MKARLSDAQKQLEMVKIEKLAGEKETKMLKDRIKHYEADTDDLETVRRDLASAQRELEHLRLASKYDTEERQKHVDKIRSQEDLTKQLELDNRELAQKVREGRNLLGGRGHKVSFVKICNKFVIGNILIPSMLWSNFQIILVIYLWICIFMVCRLHTFIWCTLYLGNSTICDQFLN